MMKTYNFDEIIDRSGSGDLKHEALLPRWGRNDLLPLWVADMDFACPDFVVEALKERLFSSYLWLYSRTRRLSSCYHRLDTCSS